MLYQLQMACEDYHKSWVGNDMKRGDSGYLKGRGKTGSRVYTEKTWTESILTYRIVTYIEIQQLEMYKSSVKVTSDFGLYLHKLTSVLAW